MKIVPTREGYDLWSEIYDAEDNALIALERQFFPALIGPIAGATVLDVGGGTGRQAIDLVTQGAQVTLLDFSEKMMAKAREKIGGQRVHLVCQDITRGLAVRSGCCDLVISCLVLDHIADLIGLMKEMKRVCRPTGAICLSVMHPAMNLLGVQARFNDPATGEKTYPLSLRHQISDYVMAAVGAGLTIEVMQEYVVDDQLTRISMRAQKYLGQPLLLLMRLLPRAKNS